MSKADKTHGAIAARKGKAGKLNVLVFEPEGGAPYTVDVEPEDSIFKLPGKDLSYKITRGSVWIQGGTSRTCVNAANPQTVNIQTLTGSDVFSPSLLNGIVDNNLATQVVMAAKKKPIWAQGATWGILGMGLLMGLLLFWLTKTIGSGLEDVQGAIENMKIIVQQAADGGTAEGGASSPSTHQPIAPGEV